MHDAVATSPSRVRGDFLLAALLTASACAWLALRLAPKIAWINLLPNFVLLLGWTLFIGRHYRGARKAVWIAPALILVLRLPFTLSPVLVALNWLLFAAMIGLVLTRLSIVMRGRGQRYLFLALALLLFNTFTHLGLDSPFTYTFRMINGMPSNFHGSDNDMTWECAHENFRYVVHCDARHFVAAEKMLVDPQYDPAFSVTLRRFGFGYVSSLLAVDGNRWVAGVVVNLAFWLFACATVYLIALRASGNARLSGLTMLCCACAWGFVDMVAQPAPYLLSYAWTTIALWALLELVRGGQDTRRRALLILLAVPVVTVYDAYPIMLACAALLVWHRAYLTATAVFAAQILVATGWDLSMRFALGTQGNLASISSGVGNLSMDLAGWRGVLGRLDAVHALDWLGKGVGSWLYGNLFVGAVAAAAWTVLALRGDTDDKTRALTRAVLCINLAVLLAMIFIAPQMLHWSPATGMVPRIAFFCFTLNLVALMLICTRVLGRHAWIVPAAFFVAANLDISGFASIALLFDYGRVGIFWK